MVTQGQGRANKMLKPNLNNFLKGWVSIPERCDKMTTITINRNNRTIVISKAFEKKASKYGSKEYIDLVEAQRDNAGFRVVVKESKRKPQAGSKLTLEGIKRYIALHDDEEKTAMTRFKNECYGKAEKKSFFAIKSWFLENYPEAV